MPKVIVSTLVFLIFSLGAASAAEKLPPPAEPRGECYCAECGMRIKAEGIKFVSEIIFKDGKTVFFCDNGDILTYYEVHKNKERVAAMYVRDYLSGSWTEGRDSYYLVGTKVVTPMRYGILAFKDKASAEKLRKDLGGRIYSFKEIMASRIYRR